MTALTAFRAVAGMAILIGLAGCERERDMLAPAEFSTLMALRPLAPDPAGSSHRGVAGSDPPDP